MGKIVLWFFEQGRATILGDGKHLRFKDVKKKKWVFGTVALRQMGGLEYRDAENTLVYKRSTWIS